MKKLRKQRKKNNNKSEIYSKAIRGKVSDFITNTPPQQIIKNLPSLMKSPILNGVYFKKKTLQNDLIFSSRVKTPNKLGLWVWIIHYLLYRKEDLLDFKKTEDLLASHILANEMEKALDLTKNIDESYGQSIKIAIIRYQILEKLNIDTNEEIETIADPLCKHIIIKSTKRKSGDELFEYNINRQKTELLNSSLNENIKNILDYHLFPQEISRSYSPEIIASFLIEGSLIDIHNFISNEININFDSTNQEFDLALKHLNDKDEKSLCQIIGKRSLKNPELTEQDIKYIDILDKIIENKENELTNLKYNFFETPLPLCILIELAKSDFNFKLSGKNHDIVLKIRSLLNRDENFDQSQEWLLSTSYKFRSILWFNQLWLYSKAQGKNTKYEDKERYLDIVTINSPNTPEKLRVTPEDIKDNFLKLLSRETKKSSSLYFYSQIYINNIRNKSENKLSPFHRAYCRAFSCLSNGDYRQAEIIAKEILPYHKGYRKFELTSLLIKSLINQEKNNQAVQFFIASHLENKNISNCTDLQNIIKNIINKYTNSDNIDYPIIFSIYKELVSDEHEIDLEYSFEIFLEKNNFPTPLDITKNKKISTTTKIDYFLENVCTLEILTSHINIESEEKARQHRIRICQYLIEKGNDSPSIISELIELKRQALLKKLKRQVDSSRIYVDTSAFTGRESQNYKNLFNRYFKLRNTYDHTSDQHYDLYENLQKSDATINIWDSARIIYLVNPAYKNQDIKKRKDIFYSIVTLFREVFINGEKGLNNYLSTRIRHGVLPTALRDPINSEGLYIASDTDFLIWKDNQPYIKKNEPRNKELFNLIKSHSLKYDKIINEVNNNYLQIETISSTALNFSSDNSKRLFKYDINSMECYILEKQLSPKPTYDELVKVLLDFLWMRTEKNLASARDVLTGTISDSFTEHLLNLKESFQKSSLTSEIKHDYCNKIDRTRSNLKLSIEQVSRWFTISGEKKYSDCNIEDVVDIVSGSLGINVERNIEGGGVIKLRGNNLSSLVDFFTILIENAISKSGLSKSEINFSVIFYKTIDNKIVIQASNYCSEKVSNCTDYKFYLEAYGYEDLAKEVVHSEGGSGFFKIWNLLYKTLGISHSIAMSKEKNIFTVTFTLERSEIFSWL